MLLDCPLEYKKGESQTNVEITAETVMYIKNFSEHFTYNFFLGFHSFIRA